MARIAVTSAVYLGDVAPYLAVARRLAERGHDVVAVLPEGFRSMVDGEPFSYAPYALDCSPVTMHADPEHERLMRHPFANSGSLGRYWVDRSFADDVDGAEASLRNAFHGADAVLTHPTFGLVSIPVARSMGIPSMAAQLFPMMIPTQEWTPPLGSRSPRLPPVLSRALWWALRHGSGRAMRDDRINSMRTRLGQPPIRGAAGFSWLDADRSLILTSRHYFGEPATDWPTLQWAGFATWEGPPSLRMTPELHEFMTEGSPPVLVTLGTSAATGAADAFREIRTGIARLGRRSVVLTGGSVDVGDLAGQPGVVPFAPVTEVLRFCSVAVVSGALGGMAAAMTAGVPIVIHPQLFDQVWNGRRVEQLGIGVSVRKPGQVADAVRRILDDPGYAVRAAAFAGKLADEDGADACARALEQMI